jgi:hypothetical protein
MVFEDANPRLNFFSSSDSDLREIEAFGECTALCRLEIPSSVATSIYSGLAGCALLDKLGFSSHGHFEELCEFGGCGISFFRGPFNFGFRKMRKPISMKAVIQFSDDRILTDPSASSPFVSLLEHIEFHCESLP